MTDEQHLPDGWACTTLGEAVAPSRMSVQPSEYPGLQFIGMEHVEAETMRLLGSVPATEMRSNALHFWSGDVLYGRLRPYLNKVLRPDFEGLCSAEFIIFQESLNLESRYLQYFLNSWGFKSFASHLNEGDRPRVDWDQLKDYPFPLAPLAEQRRIVAAIEQQFTRLDAGVAALKRAQIALKRYRAAVLKAAIEGRLTADWRAAHPAAEPAETLLARILAERRARWEADLRAKGKDPTKATYAEPKAPDTASLPTLPDGWAWATLELVAAAQRYSMSSGPFGSALGTRDYQPTGVPVIRGQNISNGRFNLNGFVFVKPEKAEQLGRSLAYPGDLVVVAVGTSGNVAIVPPAIQQAVLSQNCNKVTLDQALVLPEWVALTMQTESILSQLREKTTDTVRQFLSLTNLKQVVVPLPPLAEQEQIVAEVERRLSVVGELETTIAANLKRAERLRQSILREAFAGRLVPQDASDEPAGVLLARIQAEREEQRAANGHGRNGHGRRNGSAAMAETTADESADGAINTRQQMLWHHEE